LEDLGWRLPDLPDPTATPHADDEADEVADLDAVAATIRGCTGCRLHESRKQAVPGEGASQPAVLLVGEAPGAKEDASGRPFVGEAGQLLDAMLRAVGLDRRTVFITNVVKCRPPGNRNPTEPEMTACRSFLDRQIQLLSPKLIVCLGKVPAHWILGSTKSMRALRGRWYSYRKIPVLPTFHPAYLLRSPTEKRAAWEDLKMLRARLREARDT
jgi:DNA polymerase